MRAMNRSATDARTSGRRNRAWCAGSALAGFLLAGLAGCNSDEAWAAFKSGASDQLQAGLNAILDGVVNGAFSAFDLSNGDSGSANTSGATASSTSSSSSGTGRTTP